MKETFYMVYLQGGNEPSYQHSTYDGAVKEAKRLAKKYGRKSYVLCSMRSFIAQEFIEEDCCPFELKEELLF